MTSNADVVKQSETAAVSWTLGGRYRVLDRLGVGGMADVFRAQDEVLQRCVAVKIFRVPPPDIEAARERDRQQTELHALAMLNHPNLVTLYDGSTTSEPPFLVMELIDGPTLADQLARGPLSEQHVRALAIQIADALAYVHARGMVHRDVKPANILLGRADDETGPGWRARLTDFGIVRIAGSERLTSANLAVGSASYLAPEQARGLDVGPCADIYSLGLVLIEALTGRRSFAGPALEALAARLAYGPEIPANLPAPWPALLTAMTAMDPAMRPAAAELATELRRPEAAATTVLAAASPVAVSAVATPPYPVDVNDVDDLDDSWDGRRHHLGRIAAVLLALLAGGIFLLVMNSGWTAGGNSDRLPPVGGQSISSAPTTSQAAAPKAAAVTSAAAIHTSARASTPATKSAVRVVVQPPGQPVTVQTPTSTAPVSPTPTPTSSSVAPPSSSAGTPGSSPPAPGATSVSP